MNGGLSSPQIHSDARFSKISLGREAVPVLVIDQLLSQPERLLDFAVQGDGFAPEPSGFYPGQRKSLPLEFSAALIGLLHRRVLDIFCHGADQPVALKARAGCLSVAMQPRETLRPIQCLPHFDDTRADQLAVVLYLFHGSWGGTGFYRHRRTGFERIGAGRLAHYAPQLKREAMQHPELGGRYMARENVLFESIGQVEASFNRAIVYPSNCLHSGLIDNAVALPSAANEGRLTANFLMTFDNTGNFHE